MKKILSLALVVCCPSLSPPRSPQGVGPRRRFSQRVSSWWIPYWPYPYGYPYGAYPAYAPEPAYQPQTQVRVAPSVEREVCYPSGCYYLQGDAVTGSGYRARKLSL